jgi:serine/threonine protein phosphatase 1
MRIFIIGDVHGLHTELTQLQEALAPEPGDRFIFVGDLVDKGPESLKVMRMVEDLIDLYPGSACVAGNHESKALERLRQDKLYKTEQWARDATEEDWAFIKSMPLYHRVPELNVIVVHGGFFPRFFDLYPQGLDDDRLLKRVNWQSGGGRYFKRARRFQYTRYIDPATGDVALLGDEGPHTPRWAELYDGREGFAFYGHQPDYSGSPYVSEFAVGVDTAAVAGMFLTAAVLDPTGDGGFILSYVQVPATEETVEAHNKRMEERGL